MDASRVRAGTLLVLTFALGAAVGVAGDRFDLIPGLAQATESESPSAGRGSGPAERRTGGTTIERFADDLGLTEEQGQEIEEFLDYYRTSVKSMQVAVRPRYRALLDSVLMRIESVLTDHQVEQYRELLDERYGGRREGGRPERQDEGPNRRDDAGAGRRH